MIRNRVEKGRYLDSVALMRVSRRLAALPGVEAAAAMLGTPANRTLLRQAGLLVAEGEAAGPNDLIIAVRGSDPDAALNAALAFLSERPAETSSLARARSLKGALQALPDANLALVSVPGAFAAHEARAALERGLNVLVFSDNVPLEEEVALKRLAKERGLLLMGPDCGTALIGGTPIAFANAVPRGEIGIVAASGTGLQEVSTLIARLGGGVSHGIGVGGRDLDERVGALGTLAAIEALEADPGTSTIVLISKPPPPQVASRVRERLKASPKPSVVCFIGSEGATLRGAAEAALGRKLEWPDRPEVPRVRGKVIGLYCGGTLCAEAQMIFANRGNHEFIDLGGDEYTRGRPHPMIEPELRNGHVARALADPQVAVLLFDLVLGYGSHANPAQVLVDGLRGTKKLAVASVTGTEHDPQRLSRQRAILKAAGVIVAPSNAHAAEFAASLEA
ncbi:MAG TPA: acyl-CoA synthetase FdrA [Burkholderiales bacterium]|nr:acyl-CoA synthetase FdrA [Burkholderiales bacterium]